MTFQQLLPCICPNMFHININFSLKCMANTTSYESPFKFKYPTPSTIQMDLPPDG